MNTMQLECFVQVAETLNFRRAAEELHLSQPTVSKQVAALEAEIGGELFARTTKSVALTELGRSLLPDAREILRLAYGAAARAHSGSSGTRLALGYSDPNDLPHVAPALDGLRHEYADLHVEFAQDARDANIERLLRGQLDAVLAFEFGSSAAANLAFHPLRRDTLCCVVRTDSPLAGLAQAGGDEVEGLPQVVCLPPGLRRRGYGAQADIPRTDERLTAHCTTTSEALCLVDAGFGYALLPAVSARPTPNRRILPWRDSSRAVYGVYTKAGTPSPACARFMQLMQGELG